MPSNLTDAEENRLLDLSLADGDLLVLTTTLGGDAAAGVEVEGGSYAAQPITWAPASGGVRASTNDQVFPDMPGVDILGWEVWDDAATVRRWWGVFNPVTASVTAATDTFAAIAHGLANDAKVVFQPGYAPAGIAAGTTYFVRDSTPNSFKVAAVLGGAPVDITADLSAVVVGKVATAEVDVAFSVNAGNVALSMS